MQVEKAGLLINTHLNLVEHGRLRDAQGNVIALRCGLVVRVYKGPVREVGKLDRVSCLHLGVVAGVIEDIAPDGRVVPQTNGSRTLF